VLLAGLCVVPHNGLPKSGKLLHPKEVIDPRVCRAFEAFELWLVLHHGSFVHRLFGFLFRQSVMVVVCQVSKDSGETDKSCQLSSVTRNKSRASGRGVKRFFRVKGAIKRIKPMNEKDPNVT
jgi:hypothetical protein